MLEIFKTNVQETNEANLVLQVLKNNFPEATINFDLNDCDKVLRIEANTINTDEITAILTKHGFSCKVIPDKICR